MEIPLPLAMERSAFQKRSLLRGDATELDDFGAYAIVRQEVDMTVFMESAQLLLKEIAIGGRRFKRSLERSLAVISWAETKAPPAALVAWSEEPSQLPLHSSDNGEVRNDPPGLDFQDL